MGTVEGDRSAVPFPGRRARSAPRRKEKMRSRPQFGGGKNEGKTARLSGDNRAGARSVAEGVSHGVEQALREEEPRADIGQVAGVGHHQGELIALDAGQAALVIAQHREW